jgi:putative nucleotidyltransferase with HDIG domain
MIKDMGRGKRSCNKLKPSPAFSDLRERLRGLEIADSLYEVGGCLRDEVVGKPAKDLDVVAVGLRYEDLEAVLSRHGRVVPNRVGGRLVGCRLYAHWSSASGIEISLARRERSLEPGRAAFEVDVAPSISLHEDLRRRDYTINAIARHIPSGRIHDPFGGLDDALARRLRVITPESFREDPSRILRGLTRVSVDGFLPDEETFFLMRRHASLLEREPVEQIYLDLERILQGPRAAAALRLARDSGVLSVVLPELDPIIGYQQQSPYHSLTLDEHTFAVLEEACRLDAPLSVRWAALLHDVGKPHVAWIGDDGARHYYANPDDPEARGHAEVGAEIAERTLRRLKQPPRALIERVALLVREHMYKDDAKPTPLRARRFLQRLGKEAAEELMLLRWADRAGKGGSFDDEERKRLRRWRELVREAQACPLAVRDLAVDGHDAQAFGFRGPEIRELLEEFLSLVIDDPVLNERSRQLEWILRRARKAGKVTEDQGAAILAERS